MEQSLSFNELSRLLGESRRVGDALADAVITVHGNDQAFSAALKGLQSNQQLLTKTDFPAFAELTTSLQQASASFDQDQLARGQQVFRKYATDIMPVLGLYSLPYCYAAEEGSRVLVLSKYLNEDGSKRLKETGEFVLDVGAPGSFRQDGRALVAITKVRLIHAYVRSFVQSSITYETPVNQEDMLGTYLSFSLIVIRGLKKFGVRLKSSEEEAYMYLWSCIAELLGIDKELLPADVKAASVLESTIRKRQFRPNEEGKQLTRSLLKHFEQFWTFDAIRPDELMAYMIGDPVRSYLGLPAPGLATNGAVQLVSLRNAFRKFTEKNYAELFRMGDFEAFDTTPADLKI